MSTHLVPLNISFCFMLTVGTVKNWGLKLVRPLIKISSYCQSTELITTLSGWWGWWEADWLSVESQPFDFVPLRLVETAEAGWETWEGIISVLLPGCSMSLAYSCLWGVFGAHFRPKSVFELDVFNSVAGAMVMLKDVGFVLWKR